jgi:predicted unusual protein kinase regulating ubiquinone biosynthesis (AarF/ABC1/UbiB family)
MHTDVIEMTSSRSTFHGDAHVRNVLVYEDPRLPISPAHHWGSWRVKLVDFGTSRFTSPEKHRERHWKVVDDTIERIFQLECGKGWSARRDWAADIHPSHYRRRLSAYRDWANSSDAFQPRCRRMLQWKRTIKQ